MTRTTATHRETATNRTNVPEVIKNPYVPKAGRYKGQIHAHSSGSWDSIISPLDLANAYKNWGYDWISISDHNALTPEPEGLEGILFIEGMEYTHLAHLVLTKTTRPYADKGTQQAIDDAVADGTFVSIAHPLATVWNGTDPIWGVEPILKWRNYHAIAARCAVLPAYADNLIDMILSRGQHVWLTQEDDIHVKEDQPLPSSNANQGALFVFADECTEDAIMESLFAGNFYCASREFGMTITVEDKTITLDFESRVDRVQFVGKNGRILKKVELISSPGLSTASYTIKRGDEYVRAMIWVLGGTRAWTNPIWIEEE